MLPRPQRALKTQRFIPADVSFKCKEKYISKGFLKIKNKYATNKRMMISSIYHFNTGYMKKILSILIFLSLISCIVSCKKEDDDRNNFYDSNQRIGVWINSEREDTLEFIDNSNLIRKGNPYSYEEYLYRIEGEILFVRLPESSNETQHSILTEGKNTVVLGNMYITTGFGDNSGTFTKQN